MIIKGKNTGSFEPSNKSEAQAKKRGKILKAGQVKVAAQESSVEPKEVEKKPEVNETVNQKIEPKTEEKKEPEPVKKKTELELALDEFENVEVSMPEFRERYERRRGERRRGFRRIDERALVSRAQEEARNIREIAAREGYKAGLNEAQSEIEILKSSLNEFTSARKSAYEEFSDHILEIALEVAKKIIKKEVELSNDVLKSVMGEVFLELGATDEKVTVKVNPEDVDFAKASMPEILADSPIDAKVVVLGDNLVEKGSCTVIASNGVVDANFSTQLAIVQNAFGIYKGGE